jgi:Trk K+ transport system NAD-binding subunit
VHEEVSEPGDANGGPDHAQPGDAGGVPDHAQPRRFVVCGDNPLAVRLVDELVTQYDGVVTVLVASARANWAPQIAQVPGVEMVEADRLDVAAFDRAGLAEAAALALVAQDDAANVDAALIAQEMNPDLRIVIRMFNLNLGENIAQLLNNCAVISAAAIAAPAFVAAALDDTTTAPEVVAGRTVVATHPDSTRPEDVICGLAIIEGRDEPETLPMDGRRTDLVLARSRPAAPRRGVRRRRYPLRALSLLIGRRVRLVLAVFAAFLIASTGVLAWAKQVSLSQAAYVAILTALSGGTAERDAAGMEKVTLTLLSIVSVALIPVLTAAVVDAVVKARLTLAAGGLAEPVANHIVVVGLGDVGTRVVRALHEQGHEVVCVERNPDARGVKIVRDLRIPLIIGDASRNESLQAASVTTARALIIVSTDDVNNLETALLGRAANPDLRVVLRLFDGEFADRVQRAFSITRSRSVSYLAAPAFAAAMLGRQVITTIPVRRRVLLIAELPVGADSHLEGMPMSALQRPHEALLLAVRTGRQQVLWAPSPGRYIARTDHLVVVASRAGLSRLLAETAPGSGSRDELPDRLLAPWQMPRFPVDPPGATEVVGSGIPEGPDD